MVGDLVGGMLPYGVTEATKAYLTISRAATPSPAMRLALRLHIYHISLPTLSLGAWPLMLG